MAYCLPLSGHLIEDERFRRIPLSKRGTVNYDKGPKLLTILFFFTVYDITVTPATVILLILSISACLLAFFWGKLTRVLHKRTRILKLLCCVSCKKYPNSLD